MKDEFTEYIKQSRAKLDLISIATMVLENGKFVKKSHIDVYFDEVESIANGHRGTWVSSLQTTTDHTYRLMIEALDYEELGMFEDIGKKYGVTMHIVKCSKDDSIQEVNDIESEILCPSVWGEDGDKWEDMVAEAKRYAYRVNSLFGFYMDIPQNRIEATGWHFLDGIVIPNKEST